MGQAKPCVGIRLGAPRRLLISHQGRTGARTGAGRVGYGVGGQQAGQSRGIRGFSSRGTLCGIAGRPWRGKRERQAEQPDDAEQPQDQQAESRGRHEEAPCKRLSGCQNDSSKDSEERLTCQVVSKAAELSTIEYGSTPAQQYGEKLAKNARSEPGRIIHHIQKLYRLAVWERGLHNIVKRHICGKRVL